MKSGNRESYDFGAFSVNCAAVAMPALWACVFLMIVAGLLSSGLVLFFGLGMMLFMIAGYVGLGAGLIGLVRGPDRKRVLLGISLNILYIGSWYFAGWILSHRFSASPG